MAQQTPNNLHTARPWDAGEQGSEPEDTTAIDAMDAAQVLEGWWWAPGEDELAEDEELREMLAPFGDDSPALPPARQVTARHPEIGSAG